MVSMQRKLQRALSAVKDQTKIGLARIASGRSWDLEVAILKATSQDDAPVDEKYVKEIFDLLSNSPGSVTALATGLAKRLEKTRSWVVALKGLMLIHRLLRLGDCKFDQEMRLASTNGRLTLNLSGFQHSSSSRSGDFAAFVRAYSQFLDEGFSPWSNADGASGGSVHGGSLREMNSRPIIAGPGSNDDRIFVSLIESTCKFQRLLDCAIACKPSAIAKHNQLVQIALKPIVRESFRLYGQICDSISVLLDNFFDMQYDHCVLCFSIYKKAASQSHELSEYFDACKSAGVCGTFEYPTVAKISEDRIATWEEFIRDRSSNSMDGSSGMSEFSGKSYDDEESLFYIEYPRSRTSSPCNNFIGGYSKKQIETSDPRPILSTPYVSPGDHEKQKFRLEDRVDLIKFYHSPPLSSEERRRELSLALFSDPLETTISTDWEKFDSAQTENGKASWEIALESSTSKSFSTSIPSISVGFDNLILCNLDGHSLTRQMYSSNAVHTTSASSVAQPNSTLLALPPARLCAPEDPFRASVGIAPPSYVQMEDTKRKYRHLLEEQQFWEQCRNDCKRGCHAFLHLYNNPFCVPFTHNIAHAMPGSMLQYYNRSSTPFASNNAYYPTLI